MLAEVESKLSDADFHGIRDTVYEYCGIALNESKRELVHARLAKLVRRSPFDSISQYIETALSDPVGQEFSDLIDALSTNLTSFFRDSDQFKYVAENVVPAAIERRRREKKRHLLVWSAGCSSGEEPYSLAMTLCESLQATTKRSEQPLAWTNQATDLIDWDLRILATDISTRMLHVAKEGQYTAQRLADVPPVYLTNYFEPCAEPERQGNGHSGGRRTDPSATNDGRTYRAGSMLRGVVRFRRLNLLDFWPFRGPFDLIFCRNVMIYFDKTTQERLVSRFAQCLCSGGALVTGRSESLSGIAHGLNGVKPSIYVKP